MFRKDNKSDKSSKSSLTSKAHKISYDEHFTRATESIDLSKSSKFVDIGDGITRKENEIEKYTK
jgi:hypothetical protein